MLICHDCSAVNGAFIERKGAVTRCYQCFRAHLTALGISTAIDKRLSYISDTVRYVALEPGGKWVINDPL
jgi:hypothetical protein